MVSSSIEQAKVVVDQHFDRAAQYWEDVYQHRDVTGQIYRERQAAVLRMVDTLFLRRNTRILEVGCGAGATSVALASRMYRVEAVDSVEKMISATRRLAAQAGVSDLVSSRMADIHSLPYADGEFELVLAIGVMPWMPSLRAPLRELARVVAPGGHLIVTADNSIRISRLLDPVGSAIHFVGNTLRRLKLRSNGAVARMYTPSQFNAALKAAGFEVERGRTIGFGPITFAKHGVLPQSIGLTVHRKCQDLADNRIRIVRSLGSHYVVLARKPKAS
jgi:ubiquinone/menaquinone biosynthesis C-methylase UbiE